MDATDQSVGNLFSRVADAVGVQAALTVELAKAELVRDARTSWSAFAPLLVGVPLLAFGFAFANGAGALALSGVVGVPGGLGVVALANLLVGGALVQRAAARLNDAR